MGEERTIGPIHLLIEGDLVTIGKQREWTKDAVGGLLAILEEVQRREGRVFAISMPEGTPQVSQEVRRIIARWFAEHELTAMAVVNPSLGTRAAMALVVGAINFVARKQLNIRIFSAIDDARTFINTERTRLLGA